MLLLIDGHIPSLQQNDTLHKISGCGSVTLTLVDNKFQRCFDEGQFLTAHRAALVDDSNNIDGGPAGWLVERRLERTNGPGWLLGSRSVAAELWCPVNADA